MNAASLIEKKFQQTSFGNIAFLETGSAGMPPVLFVHGIPTSGFLWRHVLRFLQSDFHCYAPDLMGLGDTEVAPDRGAFDMEAQAEMLLEFMAAHGHHSFALVCHDQGGAAAQILAARLPERLTCLVITDSVCFDNWPVPTIARLQRLARLPAIADLLGRAGVVEWLEKQDAFSNFRRGVYDRSQLADETISEYLRPLRSGAARRECFKRFLLAGDSRCTQLAVAGLRRFDKPTLVLWAADDRYLSPSWGRKIFEEIPGAERFELIPFCGHFWQEERPAEFASHIGRFLAAHLAAHRPQPVAAEPDDRPVQIKKTRKRARSLRKEAGPAHSPP